MWDWHSLLPHSLHWLSWHSHHLAWPWPATSISWQNKDWILILSLHLYIRKRNRYFVAENLTAAPIRWLLSGDLLRFKAYKASNASRNSMSLTQSFKKFIIDQMSKDIKLSSENTKLRRSFYLFFFKWIFIIGF